VKRHLISVFKVISHPKAHLVRAFFWILMVPVAVHFGWHQSVFVIFLYSTYANFIGDIDAYVAANEGD
jgi:hypothetical protein